MTIRALRRLRHLALRRTVHVHQRRAPARPLHRALFTRRALTAAVSLVLRRLRHHPPAERTRVAAELLTAGRNDKLSRAGYAWHHAGSELRTLQRLIEDAGRHAEGAVDAWLDGGRRPGGAAPPRRPCGLGG